MNNTWQPIETLPGKIDGFGEKWSGKHLFATRREWGWQIFVGQVDSGNVWIGATDTGAWFELEDAPTHWMPLPEPPKDVLTPTASGG